LKEFFIGDLKIPVPIIQGGMGIGVSLSGLASAVANEGGIGTIATVGAGMLNGNSNKDIRKSNIDGVIHEIRRARQLSNGVLAVNIMSVLTDYSELVKVSIEENIDIIFSGAGLPLDLPKYKIKESKTKLVPIVSSGRAAEIIANKWIQNFNYIPDAFVIEGPEAGGHLGYKLSDLETQNHNLKDLLQDVLKVTSEISAKHNREIPVIAAGGIDSGAKMREFIELGATAIQMGTIFISTKECDASDKFKNAFFEAKEGDIKLLQSPVGLPGRAIGNEFLNAAERGEKRPTKCKYHCIKTCNPKTTNFCIADALLSAFYGDFDSGFAFSGANGYKINSMTTVKELFQRLKKEFHANSNH